MNSVRYSTPRSPHACNVERTASTPRECPATRGLPCATAQRPLPSMMMATWRGMRRAGIGVVEEVDLRTAGKRQDDRQTVITSFSFSAPSRSISAT